MSAGRAVPLLGLLLTGCYTFTPVDFAASERGRQVRAQLTASGEQQLLPRFGAGVHEVRGTLLGHEPHGMSLLASALVSSRRGLVLLDGEALLLGPHHVAALSEKRLAPRRTALFVAAVFGSVVILTESLGAGRRAPGTVPAGAIVTR